MRDGGAADASSLLFSRQPRLIINFQVEARERERVRERVCVRDRERGKWVVVVVVRGCIQHCGFTSMS